MGVMLAVERRQLGADMLWHKALEQSRAMFQVM
jgi:hypothetical protein